MTFQDRHPLLTCREAHGLRHEVRGGGVHRLVLDRPEVRNAFDPALRTALTEALEALASEPPRVLVLAGEGTVFCAGADLAHMRTLDGGDPEANAADARALSRLFRSLAAFPAPTVAAVQGAALGGGLGLVACCDWVVADPGARFATSEVRLGIVPGTISPYVLRRLGPSAAPLLLSGRRIEAPEAQRLGLVHTLVAPGETLDTTLAGVLNDLLQAGPEAARRTKALVLAACPLPDPALEQSAQAAIQAARAGEEAREGLTAFLERRTPAWCLPTHGASS